jgi:FkbM family methyltransferase
MKISVVIPCYNAADYLPNAASSILRQRINGTEIIVVDDKSSDNTLEVAEQLKQTTEHLIIIPQLANGGPAKARNAGLRQAKGEYVCFLDADDAYSDQLFATAIPILDERPWIDALEFPLKLINCHREVTERQKRIMEDNLPSNIIVRRSVALTVGGFPEGPAFRTKRAGEDIAFRRALREWGNVFRLEGVFLEYTIQRGSHFDLFMDAMEGKTNPDYNAEDVATARNGIAQHLCVVRDQIRAHAGIGKTLVLKCASGNRKFDFEVFANGASKQNAIETLTGKTYPKIPYINNVESVLDIGANIGASVIFFALNYPNARVVAVEPARQPVVLLRRNAMNHANVQIFNIGLHNVTSKCSIYLGAPDSVRNSVVRNALSSNSQEDVQLVAASTFTRSIGLDRPDIIKIDTEGCEIPIINSMIDSFRNAKAIYIEYHSEEDRLKIDRILCNTHLLYCGKIAHPHRGELVYVHNDAFQSSEMRDHKRAADIIHDLDEPVATKRLAPISEKVIAQWYRGCTFSVDWTSNNFAVWAQVLESLRAAPIHVLEIGSWEGRSALFFLNYLCNCRITCVDTFAGSEEHLADPNWVTSLPMIEQRFDANLERFKSRLEKIKTTSQAALANLGIAKRRFDLVYVDGSHRASDVYTDAVLSWSLLNRKGLMIFDDYDYPLGREERDRPKSGIDAFLSNFINEYAVVAHGYQMIIRKL